MESIGNARVSIADKSNLDIISEILAERSKQEEYMNFRHPHFNDVYLFVVKLLVIALCASLFWWSVDVYIRHSADKQTATAMAAYQEAQEAQETARLQELALAAQSEEEIQKQMATALAKLFYGASRFEDKYGYDSADFMTLARCVFNRVENKAYSGDFYEVLNQENQWIGFYDNNPVLEKYFNLALKAISEWQCETVKPISNDFLWAEFTPQGIYLKNDFNADGYAIRWRYNG